MAFKLFSLEMMKFLLNKKELSEVTREVTFLNDIDLLKFDTVIP